MRFANSSFWHLMTENRRHFPEIKKLCKPFIYFLYFRKIIFLISNNILEPFDCKYTLNAVGCFHLRHLMLVICFVILS